MKELEKYVSNFISSQFPSFYKEDGPIFIEFVKHYFEWLEDEDNILNKSRKLMEYRDIDKSIEEYVNYFKNKFLVDIPDTLQTNKRLLIKKSLDLYRSKGTRRGVDLFFRALYNTTANIYTPEDDIISPSSSKYVIPKYIEFTGGINLQDYVGEQIQNLSGTGRAKVESYQSVVIKSSIVNVFEVSNVIGNFLPNDFLKKINDDTYQNLSDLPRINGSLNGAIIYEQGNNFVFGDILSIESNTGLGAEGVAINLASVPQGLEFNIIDGGSGYLANTDATTIAQPTITINGGGGSGASFKIASYKNKTNLEVVGSDQYLNVYSSSTMNTYSSNALSDFLGLQIYVVGSIDKITEINEGTDYFSSPVIRVNSNTISQYNLSDGFGGILGNNAVITAKALIGNNALRSILIQDSGYGYAQQQKLTIRNSNGSIAYATPILGGVGHGKGYWKSEKSHISTKKYIQDSYFYQTYSYEIQTDVDIVRYGDIFKKIMHPSGVALFHKYVGKAFLLDDSSQQIYIKDSSYSNNEYGFSSNNSSINTEIANSSGNTVTLVANRGLVLTKYKQE